MTVFNRTVFDIPLTWNRTRFEATRNKYRSARKLIGTSINAQFEKQMRGVFSHNIEIEENINEINERLLKYHDKLRVLDNMIELASQSLRIYFDKRMDHVRAIITKHCNIIQQIICEEAEHWKEIHAVMNQNLINPGDIRSRNNYPQTVQKSPASNIETIDEEDDDDDEEEHVSKLVNGKTLTPLLTQMIRKSRLQSKRLTIIPSIKISVPMQQEISILRKEEQFSMHILPLSAPRQPLEIVDTTFVVKPDETLIDDDEPNGTYRAPYHRYRSHLLVPQRETLLIDSQPKIPARLCFSPTILQNTTVSPEDDINEESIDQNRTNIRKPAEDIRYFGQTFLLDIVKTEQINNDHNQYIRPTISDHNALVAVDTNSSVSSSEHIPDSADDNPAPPVQQKLVTVQETVSIKSRTRTTTKTKSKPVIVSTRKTRSAAKVIAEREAAAAISKAPVEKAIEKKRKTRKRKQSKSIDHRAETSDDENENPQPTSTHMINTRRKTKRRKKSKTDHHLPETSDDDHKRKTRKRSKSKRNDRQQDTSNDNENNTRKTKKFKEQDISDNENDKTINSTKHKKVKLSTIDNDEKKTKKRKQKTKKLKKDEEDQIAKQSSIRSSPKRNHRPN